MAIRSTGRPGKPRSDEEEEWPWRDPGHREWHPTPREHLVPEVDWTPTDKKIGSIFLPDGEELEIWSDPVPFGFARYAAESEQDE